MYINLLYLPLFNFAYLFFLSLLSSQHICQFYFHCFIPQLAPCFCFPVSDFSQFCFGRYNFWFPLFAGSIYCTLCLLVCSDFDYRCLCICVYSVTLFIVVINFCLYIWVLQFCGVLLFSFFFHFFSFLFYNFNFQVFKTYYIFSTFILLFAFPTVLFPLQLTFNVYKFSSSTSI